MSRRHIAYLVLALTTFALSACADLTGPKANDGGCQVTVGSDTCRS